MKKAHITLLALGLGIMGCAHNTKADSASSPIPEEYQSVIDSVREQCNGESRLYSEYFLYDITGDSIPELWIKLGSCEADTKLLAFTANNGTSTKIYDDEGGHSDYFVLNNQLVCVMCNTGAGVVITYEYDGKRVTDSMVEFSTWNENGDALSKPHDSIADEKLKYWEDNYGNYIELKPL